MMLMTITMIKTLMKDINDNHNDKDSNDNHSDKDTNDTNDNTGNYNGNGSGGYTV